MPPALPANAHKGAAGRLLCLAGSPAYPGAAQLVVRAAARGGAGLVTLGILREELVPCVAPAAPEAVYLDLTHAWDLIQTRDLHAGGLLKEIAAHLHDARLAGPGLGQEGATRELVHRLIESDFEGPLLLDADALNVLVGSADLTRAHPGPVVLTPHPGEAARLLDRPIPTDPTGRLAAAQELAEVTRAVCVLKGHRSIVCDGERAWIASTGNAGMATAGSGDVLAGLAGAYLAGAVHWGGDPFDALCAAVHVHGLAGDLAAADLGERAVVASDLIAYLGAAQIRAGAG